MYIIVPKEIKQLKKEFEPFLDGVKLKESAPQKSKEAYEKYFEWYDKELEKHDYYIPRRN